MASAYPFFPAFLPLALLCACDARDDANQAAPPPIAEAVETAPSAVPLPAPALDRAALLKAVGQAASAYAAGIDDSAAQAALDGRRFAIRLRFGCHGPAEEGSGAPLRWRVKSDSSLEITATPDLSLTAPELAGAVTQTVEAVEGFWIARPWLLSDACPARRSDLNAPPAPPDHSVGIAQYSTPEGSRTERRSGRPYVSIAPLKPGEVGSPGTELEFAL